MKNHTILNGLFLSGLSNVPALRLPLFLFFFLIYLLTIIWNWLILALIVSEPHLHTPMYFFLGNLASLDLCSSSVIMPRMLFDLLTQRRKISLTACIAQVFFFLFFAISESFLLSLMSYDRYTAICQPLHYVQIMSWNLCVQLGSLVWCLGFTYSLVHTLGALQLTFCDLDIIESFFCDLPQLFQISCSDIYINVLLIFTLSVSSAVGCLILTFMPYVYIFKTVLNIKVKGKRSIVFSTCASHLAVVFIFYGSFFFNYFQSNARHQFASHKVVSMFYTVILPLLNPLIYSLRNHDFRRAFQNVMGKIQYCSK